MGVLKISKSNVTCAVFDVSRISGVVGWRQCIYLTSDPFCRLSRHETMSASVMARLCATSRDLFDQEPTLASRNNNLINCNLEKLDRVDDLDKIHDNNVTASTLTLQCRSSLSS